MCSCVGGVILGRLVVVGVVVVVLVVCVIGLSVVSDVFVMVVFSRW